MSDKMREAFEEWAVANEYSTKTYDSFHEDYYHDVTQSAWRAWQAAQSAAVPVVGEVVAIRCGNDAEGWTIFSPDVAENYAQYTDCNSQKLVVQPTTSITAAELDALRKDAESNAARDIAVMRASIIAYKEARNGIERHPGNTAHENAAWEWGRKDGGWENKK